MKVLLRRSLLIAVSAILFAASASGQSTALELSTILERVRERMTRSYLNLQKLAWTDTVREETLKEDRTPKDKPRDSVYDMIIRLQQQTPGDDGPPFYVREQRDLKLVNGKPAGKKDETGAPQGTLGHPVFLLTKGDRAAVYGFSYAGQADLDGRKTLLVDVTYPWTEPRVTWDERFVLFGVQKFQVIGLQYTKGRIWIDADTYDVLRIDWRTIPFEFQRPKFRTKITYQRENTTRFKTMTFENPGQTHLVPESVETVWTIRKGSDVTVYREFRSFGNYQRFTGEIQIAPAYPK